MNKGNDGRFFSVDPLSYAWVWEKYLGRTPQEYAGNNYNRLFNYRLFLFLSSCMSQFNKLIMKILLGYSDKNVKFSELTNLLNSLGFEMRITGSHHIFRRDDIPIRINLQREGDLAKAYQVKQVRNLIIEYKLSKSDEE